MSDGVTTDPPQPGVKTHRRTMPFLRPGLKLEDAILYAFGAVVLAIFWVMFADVQERETALAASMSGLIAQWQPRSNDLLPLAHMKAQLVLSTMRYEQAARTSASISTRRNFGFLIGAILALLGSIIAIRATRGDAIDAEVAAAEYVKVKMATTSAGALIALLGTVIVLATVLNNDHVQVDDRRGIVLAPAEVITEEEPSGEEVQTSTNTDDVLKQLDATRPQ